MIIRDRFLKYVSFDTQSDEHSSSTPSTLKQLELGKYLVTELKQLGIENACLDKNGIVYATVPANNGHQGKVIGFIAHMDTADFNGHGVSPRLITNYDGGSIILDRFAHTGNSQVMFYIGYVVYFLVILNALALGYNLLWKIKLMKGEKALLEAGLQKEVA